jgi:hypothetical protein
MLCNYQYHHVLDILSVNWRAPNVKPLSQLINLAISSLKYRRISQDKTFDTILWSLVLAFEQSFVDGRRTSFRPQWFILLLLIVVGEEPTYVTRAHCLSTNLTLVLFNSSETLCSKRHKTLSPPEHLTAEMGGKRGANALQNEISSVRRSKRFRPGIEQKLDADEEIHDERDLSPEVALRNKEELRNRAKGSGRSKEGEKEEQLTLKNNELTCQGDIYVDNPLAREGRKEEEEVISGKASSRGNIKDETSDQAMPLAARTPGLRMCIGAHVSAAKGVFAPGLYR